MRRGILIILFFPCVFSLYAQNLNLQVSALESEEAVNLSWNSISQPQDVSYLVFRAPVNGKPVRLASDLAETVYSDTTAEPGVPYLYSVRAVSANGRVLQSGEEYGVRGVIPQPQITVSLGMNNSVLIRCQNRLPYLKVNVSVSRPYYNPRYRIKEAYSKQYGNHAVNENSSIPFNYEDALCYAIDPRRGYTTPSYLCKNSPWDEISDTKATPGNNLYTVQYVYTLPNGKEKLSPFAEAAGCRNISDREFLDEVLMTIERSQFKLNLIHRGGTAPNGFDAVEDDKKSDNAPFAKSPKNPPKGWLYYDCDFSLMKMLADVTLIYQTYRDYDIFLTTDTSRAHRSVVGPEKITNINDTKVGDLIGVILVSGIYNGEIEFHIRVGNRNAKPPYAADSPFYSAEQQERFFYSGKKGPGDQPGEPGNGSYYIVRQKKNGAVVSQSIFAWDYDRKTVDARLLKLRSQK